MPPPTIPSAVEIYRHIMAEIEKDLLPENLIRLDELYQNETPEQTKQRAERYSKAFERYAVEYAKVTAQLTGIIKTYLRKDLQELEQQVSGWEQQVLQNLEDQISSP